MCIRDRAYSVLKQERRNFHLIAVPISGIDILKAVRTAACCHGAAHVALFLGRTINVDLELLEDLCHVKISRYAVDNDDEVLEAFDRLQAENACDTVVGGYTACRIAQALSLIHIYSYVTPWTVYPPSTLPLAAFRNRSSGYPTVSSSQLVTRCV